MDDASAAAHALIWTPVTELGPAARVRRLAWLHEATSFGHIDEADVQRVRARLERVVTGCRGDVQAPVVVEELMGDRCPRIPVEVGAAMAAAFGVSSDYFADAATAERDDAVLLPRLLSQSGVDPENVALCRIPPDRRLRTSLCVKLLEVARKRGTG